MSSKALLIINIGTPDAPTKKAVRQFLSQFLNDKFVIDLPWILRKVLVNGIILPFRLRKSMQLYQRIWTTQGSPLLLHLNSLKEKLQHTLGDKITVFAAMRYGNPSLEQAIEEIEQQGFQNLIVLPLYPQYADSTTLSTINEVKLLAEKHCLNASLRFIEQFYHHDYFIQSVVERVRAYHIEDYDHIIFSYHGLPLRHINKLHPKIKEKHCSCQQSMPAHGEKCYKAACYATTRLLAEALELKEANFSVGFQSRLSKNWLYPFTDELIVNRARQGAKNMLVISPSFVADCLETTVEIAQNYQQLFQSSGGKTLQLVPAINDSSTFVEGIASYVLDE